ncbi:MAG: response regulator [Candidatus Eisenbacteria bacterium]
MPNGRILVVDDEPFILRSLMYLFEREGFEVFSAIDGAEALERVLEHRPGLVFLDIMMPGRDGYEVCRAIKNDPELRDTHVVMLTAKGREADRRRGLAAGADDYVTKPFSPTRIVEMARAILGASPAKP